MLKTVALAIGLLSSSGIALGLGFPAAVPDSNVQTQSYDYNGIVALSNCSGSLVRFEDSLDSDPGMILTNGHCVAMMAPGVAYVNRSSSKSFRLLDDQGGNLGSVRASKLIYATLTDTDLGLYELRDSFEDIYQRYGVEALTISSEAPDVGEDIEIISGYWKRGYSCSIDKEIFTLQEGRWSFKRSLRYSQPGCEVVGGTSGSPIIRAGTRTVIAVNNTGNESGRRCTQNNPCEIGKEGNVFYEKGQNYGQQIFWLYSCRSDNGGFDFKKEECLLPNP